MSFPQFCLNAIGQVQAVDTGTVTQTIAAQGYVGSSPLVSTDSPTVTDNYAGGFKYSSGGALRIYDATAGLPAVSYPFGSVRVTANGQLCVNISSVDTDDVVYVGGLAVTNDGRVYISTGGGSAYTGPLDLVPGAVVALDQFAPSASMIGLPYATIRSSGGGSQSFNYGETPPTAAIATFLGVNDGFYSTWRDGSGAGKDAVQVTELAQPAYLASAFGAVPTLSFVNYAEFLATASIAFPSSEMTVFLVLNMSGLVARNNPIGINYTNFSGTDGVLGNIAHVSGGTDSDFEIDAYDGSGNEMGGKTDAIVGACDVNCVIDYKVGTGVRELKFNGVSINFASTYGDTVSSVSGLLAIGANDADNPSGLAFYQGNIGAVYMYPMLLSDGDRALVRSKLAANFNITLP